MIVVTYTFTDGFGEQMAESVKKQGYELAVIKTINRYEQIMRDLYECYKRAETGHDYMIYADAADCYFQRRVNIPTDYILYSAEKNCFPYKKRRSKFTDNSRWRYLNNGLYGGPIKLVVEFFEKYNLNDIGTKNPQAAAQDAYFDAIKDGFPIKLDSDCKEFQSYSFIKDDEYEIRDSLIYNRITNTTPAVLHFNGLTDKSILNQITNNGTGNL